MNTCALCATPFEYVNNGPGRKRKYCSQSCRKKASRKPSPKPCTVAGCNNRHLARGLCSTHYNQQYQPDRHARVDVPCTYCGTMTTTGKSNSKKRRPVCSEYCKSALRFPPKSELPTDHWALWYGKTSTWPKHPLIECGGCGVRFAPQHPQTTCCSDRCRQYRDTYRAGGTPEHIMATVPRQCKDCGTTYSSPYAGQERCKPCKRKATRGRWISNKRRFTLYQRDKFKCHICNKKTNINAHYLDSDYPTLDHLVPRSKGGSDEDYNLATCCRECNTLRGANELPMLQLA